MCRWVGNYHRVCRCLVGYVIICPERLKSAPFLPPIPEANKDHVLEEYDPASCPLLRKDVDIHPAGCVLDSCTASTAAFCPNSTTGARRAAMSVAESTVKAIMKRDDDLMEVKLHFTHFTLYDEDDPLAKGGEVCSGKH